MGCVYTPRLRTAKNTLLVLLLLCLNSAFAQVGLSSSEAKLLSLLNQDRAREGLPKLEWNYQLAEAARAHTELLANHQALSHRFSEEAALGDRIGTTGLRFDVAAENVAAGSSVEDIHKGLMDSPQHRANILSPKYNSIGIAIIPRGIAIIPRDDELWVTEDFANALPTFSEGQFRDAVIAEFNKKRTASGLGRVVANVNAHLHDLACSDDNNAQQMLQGLPGATTLVVFTSSTPEKLSPSMEKEAADRSVRRLDIGVCFKPGKEHGYGSFRILAALYP